MICMMEFDTSSRDSSCIMETGNGKQMREAGSRCGKRRVEIRTREKERKEIQG